MTSRPDAIKARAEAQVMREPHHDDERQTPSTAWCGGAIRTSRTLAAAEAVLNRHEPEATGYGDWACGACIRQVHTTGESTGVSLPNCYRYPVSTRRGAVRAPKWLGIAALLLFAVVANVDTSNGCAS